MHIKHVYTVTFDDFGVFKVQWKLLRAMATRDLWNKFSFMNLLAIQIHWTASLQTAINFFSHWFSHNWFGWRFLTCLSSMPTKKDPDSKVHGANMGPIWDQQDPGGPHGSPMNMGPTWGPSGTNRTQVGPMVAPWTWGQHGAHLGPTAPRWAPWWPHELCHLGIYSHWEHREQKRPWHLNRYTMIEKKIEFVIFKSYFCSGFNILIRQYQRLLSNILLCK